MRIEFFYNIPPTKDLISCIGDIAEIQGFFIVPHALAKAGDIKTHSSFSQSVCPSVTKTLTWLISSEVFMIEHWYVACMVLVTSLFYWNHAVTLTLTFDLFNVKFVAVRGTTILRIFLLVYCNFYLKEHNYAVFVKKYSLNWNHFQESLSFLLNNKNHQCNHIKMDFVKIVPEIEYGFRLL